jgi:hypothetical protein
MAARRSTGNASQRDATVHSLGFHLLQQLQIRRDEFTSGAEVLKISSATLRIISRLYRHSSGEYLNGSYDMGRSRQGSLFTSASEPPQTNESPEDYLHRLGIGAKLLRCCGFVSSLEVDGKSDSRPRGYDLEMFGGLRRLVIRNAQIESVSGVKGVATLHLSNSVLMDDPAKFLTLRTIELGSKDLVDMRNLPAMCFSLRNLTVRLDDTEASTTFVPHFHPTASHLRVFDRATCAVEPWDGLTRMEITGPMIDAPRRVGRMPFAKLNPSMQYLQHLRRLCLQGLRLANLEGLEPMRHCAELHVLDLSHNAIRLLEPAAALPNSLTALNLADNFLTGAELRAVGTLPALKRIDVSTNDVTVWAHFRMLPATVTDVVLHDNPVHNGGPKLYESTDDYVRYVRNAVLQHCTELSTIDGLDVLSRHVKSDAEPEVSRWRTTVANLQPAISRFPAFADESEPAAPSADVRARSNDVAPRSALRRTKSKTRRGVRTRGLNESKSDILPLSASAGDGSLSLIADAAARRSRSEHYLDHPNFRLRQPETDTRSLANFSAMAASPQAEARPQEIPAVPVEERKRRQPASGPAPALLERFVRSLTELEWTIAEGDKRRKIFPSGIAIDESVVGAENGDMWETSVPSDEGRPRQGRAYAVVKHDSAREYLLRDSRKEPQGQDLLRFNGKLLVRVVECSSGRTRYLRIETKSKVGSFGGRRPSFVVTLPCSYETASKEVRVTAAFNDGDGGAEGAALRPRSTTLAAADVPDTGDLLGSEMVGQVGHVLHEVEQAKMLCAFAVPNDAASQFIDALRQQLATCHGALVTNGIVRQWPMHLDVEAQSASEDLSHAVPVLGSLSVFLDQVRSNSDTAVAARQRHGCDTIFSRDDELKTHLQTRVFATQERFNAIIYTHLWHSNGKSGDTAAIMLETVGMPVIMVVTPTSVMWAEDRNYAEYHGAGYVKESATFGPRVALKLADLQLFEVSFDAHHFALHFKNATLVCSSLDRSATLSIAGAFAQVELVSLSSATSRTGGNYLSVQPCPYPFLTTSPLIFGISVFFCAPTSSAELGGWDPRRMFPTRHLPSEVASRMVLASFIITATDAIVARIRDPLGSAAKEANVAILQRMPMTAVRRVRVASGTKLMPLIFMIEFHNAGDERTPKRWLLCAPHPATIACIVKQLQRSVTTTIAVSELDAASFDGHIAASKAPSLVAA